MTGVAADIEHRTWPQRLHGPVDKRLLLLPFLVAIVIGGDLVLAPARTAPLWLQGMQFSTEASKIPLQNRRCDFRLLLQLRRRSPSPLAGLEQVRKGDQRAKGCAPALETGKIGVQVDGLITVAAIESSRKRPPQFFECRQREKKGARKLPIGKPKRTTRVTAFDGQQVYKYRARAIEQNVERCCIFEDPAFAEQLAA